MTEAPLVVWHEGRVVGTLSRDDGERLAFRYDEAWLGAPDRFAISCSLPLEAAPNAGPAARAFFANLLPEGIVRERVCRKLGLSVDNDFALLAAIGGECAGALSLLPAGASPDGVEATYRRLTTTELARLSEPGRLVPLVLGGPSTRLSLAGAQDKLPVYVDGDRIYLPTGTAPSSHILKIGGAAFSHLVANEALVTAFARALGLDVVDATLLPTRAAPLLLVRRFDRVVAEGGKAVRRLHQEDMCQALGRLPSRKYQIEGGPSLSECVGVLRAHSATPLADTERLLRWVAFNLLAGNADGHGKNVSLVHPRPGSGPRLAPCYDLVCTRAYRALDRRLAMPIGGQVDPGQVGARHWRLLAEELAVTPRVVLDITGAMVDAARAALVRAVDDFRQAHGEHPALQLVTAAVRRQIRRTEQLLERAHPG